MNVRPDYGIVQGPCRLSGILGDEDADPLAINLGIDRMLRPDGATIIEIDIDFAHALTAINWDTVSPGDGGRLEVDAGDTVITEFRKKLVESFSTSSPTAAVI